MTIPFLTDDIVKIIDELASESTAVYGTTAFWTIHPDYFYSKNFLKVLPFVDHSQRTNPK